MDESYIRQMNMKENLCMDYEQKASDEENTHNKPTKQQCIYLQKAASLRAELAQMSIGEEKLYQQRKLNDINRKIKDIIRQVDPDFYNRFREEKERQSKKEENVKSNVKPSGNTSSGSQEDSSSWFKEAPKHSFDDVSGMNNLKEQLKECIATAKLNGLKEYMHMKKLHSYFFIGPPGCGKTYIIEAFAHELMDRDYKYLSLSGADILSRYVGEAEKIIKKLFQEAMDNAPCIVFIDEMDGVCKNRSLPNLPEYASSMTTAFLTGYNQIHESDKDIIFIGATNYPNQVDDAMLDRVELIRVPFPDQDAREMALKKGMENVIMLAEDITFSYMAESTEKFNYRDIDRLMNRIKKRVFREVIAQYGTEDQMIQALKDGEYRIDQKMFDEILDDFIPTPKDEIEKELDEWEKRFKKRIE